ncbi:hypothetical protein TRFO_20143 [Tritrichomonas foetus]|uniref:Integral membrane protein n=1 Tax=Tritrichomonas foetus TaxID=1144522 RepID=A0A1J4KLI3_9EUKA|nr:hypothetical protein TRFO_20143 [Tritrichomonas foetus]|eukprot:OHT10550.1 hypothetical protein TRFO_20143 [Tritrichomonas foetus]
MESDLSQNKSQFNRWGRTWPLMFFLILGICNAVSMKVGFIMEGKGLDKWGYHQFQKPWWITMMTFAGQALATPIYAIMAMKHEQTFRISDLSFKDFCEFSFPALSDAFEGIVSSVCVVFVGVSIDSMMKSGTLVGVSLISHFIFKKRFPCYKWVCILFVVLSLTMVGAAGIINADSSTTIKGSTFVVAIIIILKFVSQVGYSIKISYEEYFSQVKNYHPVMISGIEGIWSTFISAFICMPIAQYMPGDEGNGIREDTLDTFEMLKNTPSLVVLTIIIVLLGFFYSIVSITLIGRTSAVVRTLMEAFRTFLIWMVQFAIFYSLRTSSNQTLYKFRLAGEEWGLGSYVQLVGFIIMTFSILTYNKIPKYPCITYENEDETENENYRNQYNKNERSETTCENATVNLSPLLQIDTSTTYEKTSEESTLDS